MDIKLRIQGSIIGLIAGDAIGHEFNKRSYKKASKSVLDQLTAQSYTDISSMSLCTMSSINDMGDIDVSDIVYTINEWYVGGFLKSSFTCDRISVSQAIRKYGNGMPPNRCGSVDTFCDNSAIIRMLPILLFTIKQPIPEMINMSQLITNFTNKQPMAEVCSALYCLIMQNLLLQKKEGAFQLLKDYYETKGQIEHINALKMLKNDNKNDHHGSSNITDTFWSSWKAYSNNEESFEETIRSSLEFENDVSATAAIAGSLSGAFLGSSAIPRKWIKQLNLSDEAKTIIKKFVNNIINL